MLLHDNTPSCRKDHATTPRTQRTEEHIKNPISAQAEQLNNCDITKQLNLQHNPSSQTSKNTTDYINTSSASSIQGTRANLN